MAGKKKCLGTRFLYLLTIFVPHPAVWLVPDAHSSRIWVKDGREKQLSVWMACMVVGWTAQHTLSEDRRVRFHYPRKHHVLVTFFSNYFSILRNLLSYFQHYGCKELLSYMFYTRLWA